MTSPTGYAAFSPTGRDTGARAQVRLLVNGTQTTVAIRLRFR